jgi:hypothetical protein
MESSIVNINIEYSEKGQNGFVFRIFGVFIVNFTITTVHKNMYA